MVFANKEIEQQCLEYQKHKYKLRAIRRQTQDPEPSRAPERIYSQNPRAVSTRERRKQEQQIRRQVWNNEWEASIADQVKELGRVESSLHPDRFIALPTTLGRRKTKRAVPVQEI